MDFKNGAVVKGSQPYPGLSTPKEIIDRLQAAAISASSDFKMSSMTYSSSVHLCAITLDIETGKVNVKKYVVVEDCGRMINKAIVEGQVHGGVMHGIGGALLEKIVYDNEANVLTSGFLDYAIPSSSDGPDIEILHEETPSKVSLNGAKGVGESGTIAAYPAVINALNDALSQIGKGISVNIAPATPDSIYSAITRSVSSRLR